MATVTRGLLRDTRGGVEAVLYLMLVAGIAIAALPAVRYFTDTAEDSFQTSTTRFDRPGTYVGGEIQSGGGSRDRRDGADFVDVAYRDDDPCNTASIAQARDQEIQERFDAWRSQPGNASGDGWVDRQIFLCRHTGLGMQEMGGTRDTDRGRDTSRERPGRPVPGQADHCTTEIANRNRNVEFRRIAEARGCYEVWDQRYACWQQSSYPAWQRQCANGADPGTFEVRASAGWYAGGRSSNGPFGAGGVNSPGSPDQTVEVVAGPGQYGSGALLATAVLGRQVDDTTVVFEGSAKKFAQTLAGKLISPGLAAKFPDLKYQLAVAIENQVRRLEAGGSLSLGSLVSLGARLRVGEDGTFGVNVSLGLKSPGGGWEVKGKAKIEVGPSRSGECDIRDYDFNPNVDYCGGGRSL